MLGWGVEKEDVVDGYVDGWMDRWDWWSGEWGEGDFDDSFGLCAGGYVRYIWCGLRLID